MGGSAVKRSIDQVDLTISDDDEQQPSKAPRSSNYTENSSSQSIRDQWLAPSTQMLREDADAEIETDEFDDDRYQRYELYGTMSTKVVGIRYYNGTATVGEFCTVRREPSNPVGHSTEATVIRPNLSPFVVEGVSAKFRSMTATPSEWIMLWANRSDIFQGRW